MKRFMTALMVLSLVLGGVALVVAADFPETSKNLDLSKMQKISDQEAKQLRGTYMSFNSGACLNNCTAIPNVYNHSTDATGAGYYQKVIYNNYGGHSTRLP